MVLFCPTCANLLLVENGPGNRMRFYCQTCPYVFRIDQKISNKVTLTRKEVDDIMGDDDFINSPETAGIYYYFCYF